MSILTVCNYLEFYRKNKFFFFGLEEKIGPNYAPLKGVMNFFPLFEIGFK